MAANDWYAALRIAAKFPELGEHREPIQRAWAAYQNPGLYVEMGYDIDGALAAGFAALKERYAPGGDNNPR
jgi:hypothetical protein